MRKTKLTDGLTTVQFIRNNAGKLSPKQMAAKLGTSANCVTGMASKRGIILRLPGENRGRKNGIQQERAIAQLDPFELARKISRRQEEMS